MSVLDMARDSGMLAGYEGEPDKLDAFAELIRAEEREECLKAVENSKIHQFIWFPKGYMVDANRIGNIYKTQHDRCMEAIRARKTDS